MDYSAVSVLPDLYGYKDSMSGGGGFGSGGGGGGGGGGSRGEMVG